MVIKILTAEICSELLLKGGMSINPMAALGVPHGLADYCRTKDIRTSSEQRASFSGDIVPNMLLAHNLPKKQCARGSGHIGRCDRGFERAVGSLRHRSSRQRKCGLSSFSAIRQR